MSHLSAPAEAPKAHAEHGHKAGAETEAKAKAKVEGGAKDAHDKVHAVVGHEIQKGGDAETHGIVTEYKPILPYTPLPTAPDLGKVGKAALATAFVVNPVATSVIAGTVKVADFGWNKVLKKIPGFSLVDKGVRAAAGAAKEGVKNVWETATYLPKLGMTAGLNVAKGAVNTAFNVGKFAKEHLYDLVHETPGEAKNILEQMYGGAKKLVGGIFSIPSHYIEALKAHPKSVVLMTALGLGAFYTNGIVETSIKVTEGFMKLLEFLISKTGL
ncbi:hypothetical protein EXS65_03940 [Candidatus Peribacteria bacterium]|nr:hypothetical protein [Candidatus Peribacteria bacterium]